MAQPTAPIIAHKSNCPLRYLMSVLSTARKSSTVWSRIVTGTVPSAAAEILSLSSRRYIETRSMSKRFSSAPKTPKTPPIKPKVTLKTCPGEGAQQRTQDPRDQRREAPGPRYSPRSPPTSEPPDHGVEHVG